MASTVKLDCKACNQEKTMVPTKVNRMSPVVVLIGWVIVIPSLLGIVLAVILFIGTIVGASVAEVASDAEATGAIGAGIIGIGASLFVGVVSLVGGLLGYLLVMKKKIYKCISCGFIMDRA